MQYEATTPEEYLHELEDDWRSHTLLALRRLIKENAPELIESIEYKMLAYQSDGKTVFHLYAQKNYVSLYIGDAGKVDTTGELLKELDVGKGCIRFKKTTSVADSNINQFIAEAVKLWNQGKDIGC